MKNLYKILTVYLLLGGGLALGAECSDVLDEINSEKKTSITDSISPSLQEVHQYISKYLGKNLENLDVVLFVNHLREVSSDIDIIYYNHLADFIKRIDETFSKQPKWEITPQDIFSDFYKSHPLVKGYYYHSIEKIEDTIKNLPNPEGFIKDSFTENEIQYLNHLYQNYKSSRDETDQIMLEVQMKLFLSSKDPYKKFLKILQAIAKEKHRYGIHTNPSITQNLLDFSNEFNKNNSQHLYQETQELYKYIEKNNKSYNEIFKKILDFIQKNKTPLFNSDSPLSISSISFREVHLQYKLIQTLENTLFPLTYQTDLLKIKDFFDQHPDIPNILVKEINEFIDIFGYEYSSYKDEISATLSRNLIIDIFFTPELIPFQIEQSINPNSTETPSIEISTTTSVESETSPSSEISTEPSKTEAPSEFETSTEPLDSETSLEVSVESKN